MSEKITITKTNSTMPNAVRGIISGLAATVVLSALMMMKTMMGIMPQLDVIGMLSGMMGTSAMIGWLAHFMIGAIFGIAFALMYVNIPGKSAVSKGIIFAMGAWILMMVAIMPMAGAGFFGLSIGIMAPIMTLMLHVIFGAVLGFSYSRLPS